MDKKKSKYKNDYSLRTLAYYQREGGIYNDLITILQRMRVGKGGRKILPPKEILNAGIDDGQCSQAIPKVVEGKDALSVHTYVLVLRRNE